jgi:hypothetical protein
MFDRKNTESGLIKAGTNEKNARYLSFQSVKAALANPVKSLLSE